MMQIQSTSIVPFEKDGKGEGGKDEWRRRGLKHCQHVLNLTLCVIVKRRFTEMSLIIL